MNTKLVLNVDEASNYASMVVNVLKEKQAKLVKYIQETYSNVTVFVKENWMRLDFNKDGSVSIEDVRKNLQEFYEFLKSYDYIEATVSIKSSIYDKAVQLLKKDQDAPTQQETTAVVGDAAAALAATI